MHQLKFDVFEKKLTELTITFDAAHLQSKKNYQFIITGVYSIFLGFFSLAIIRPMTALL